ncbi:MAG: LamG domain-containing protein, partial [Candidatus Marinimicrobia bacterium]|nr:LamG domain-containing protein [Candidatus Neomarinimicrobiota bacterium]
MVDRKIMGRRFATNLFLTLFIIAVNLRGGELISDEHTLLLLHFNDNFNDTSGVEPLTASGLTFTEGIFGKAINIDKDDTLWYPMPEQFNPAEGSVELWLSPLWTGEEPIMRVFHTHDWHPITLQIDPGMLMHPFMLVWDNEANYYDINAWSGQEWHHLAVTWKIPGEMRLYVDGVLRIHDQATELDLLGL